MKKLICFISLVLIITACNITGDEAETALSSLAATATVTRELSPTATPPPSVPVTEKNETTPATNAPLSAVVSQSQPNPYWKTYTLEDDRLNHVTVILIDDAGRKWLGSFTGLHVFDGQTWQVYTSANGLLNNDVAALALDDAGHIWVGYETTHMNSDTTGGLSMFDGQAWHHYTIALDVPGNAVRDMVVDGSGRLWFGTGHGLGRFDGQTWTMVQAPPGEEPTPSFYPPVEPPADAPYIEPDIIENGPVELASPVDAVAVDLAGQVWVGTQAGLTVFDGRQWHSHPGFESVSDITVDTATGHIWVATFGHGASVYDGQQWHHYTRADGLANDGVNAVAVDPAGRVWFGTWNRGVSVLTHPDRSDATGNKDEGADEPAWLTYTKADGLADNTVWTLAPDPAGFVWLGAGSVLQEFLPLEAPPTLPTPVSVPTPEITSFTVTPTSALTIGQTITLTWQASGEQAELCLFSGNPVECQPVPVSGSRTMTIDEHMFSYSIGQLALRVTASEIVTWSMVAVDFQCRYDWFYDDPTAGCPEAGPMYGQATAQTFEHGFMMWSEQPDQFYVFFDKDHEFAGFDGGYVTDPAFLATPEPLPTPPGGLPTPEPWPAAPPPGYVEPVRGFGQVWRYAWRYDNSVPVAVRQDIGWATGPEVEFETAYQCALGTAVYGRWTCYVRGPGGQVLGFAPVSTIRTTWVWHERQVETGP